MIQAQDYIFCPLCGEHNWNVDKTQNLIIIHTCSDCKKFKFTKVNKSMESPIGLKIFYNELETEDVIMDEYRILINHQNNETIVYKYGSIILIFKAATKFNWYKDKDVKDKIKKFLVFS